MPPGESFPASDGLRSVIAQRTRLRRHRTALAAWTIVLVVMLPGRPATAQTVIQLDGAWNLGYNATTGTGQDSSRLFTGIQPAVTLQFGSPRLAWRAGYVFAGSFALAGSGSNSYSNQLDLSLAAQLTKRSIMTVGGSIAQGSTDFQLSQRAPATSQPGFRAPGNPNLVTATLAESFAWEASPTLLLRQGLTGMLSTPQDALGQYNASVTGSLGLDRLFEKDAIGVELRPSFAVLSSLTAEGQHYVNITNALLGSWNHDFNRGWNGQMTAGVEQVLTFAGSYPLAIVPTGSLTARYRAGTAGGSLSFTHGAATDLQTGTVSMSDAVVVRGLVGFDPTESRVLAASAGFVHAEPLGEVPARVAAGTGNAVQGDVRLVWGLSNAVLATASYSVAYQFGQAGGLAPSLAHVILVGITARYSNAQHTPAMPTIGRRVDGSDAVGFPDSDARRP